MWFSVLGELNNSPMLAASLGSGLGADIGHLTNTNPLIGGLIGGGLGAISPTIIESYLKPYLEEKTKV